MYLTSVEIFDTATVPLPSTQSLVVGNSTLAFAGCTHATLAYAFTAGPNVGRSGTIALTRVGPTPAGCAA